MIMTIIRTAILLLLRMATLGRATGRARLSHGPGAPFKRGADAGTYVLLPDPNANDTLLSLLVCVRLIGRQVQRHACAVVVELHRRAGADQLEGVVERGAIQQADAVLRRLGAAA